VQQVAVVHLQQHAGDLAGTARLYDLYHRVQPLADYLLARLVRGQGQGIDGHRVHALRYLLPLLLLLLLALLLLLVLALLFLHDLLSRGHKQRGDKRGYRVGIGDGGSTGRIVRKMGRRGRLA
jgi:hypothetical protein